MLMSACSPIPAIELAEPPGERFGPGEIEPRVRVTSPTGSLAGNRNCSLCKWSLRTRGDFRNPQFDDGGWGDYPTEKAREWAGQIDNTLLEEPAQVTISWPDSMPTYDIRGRQDLGQTAQHQAILQPWSPLTFTRASKAVPRYRIETPEQVQAWRSTDYHADDESSLPEGAFRVVRLEFLTPAGHPYELYSQNVLASPHLITRRPPCSQ